MAKPLVAIVGRPNVGKSTFFNKIAGRRISIVEDVPGVTRDRIYCDVEWMGAARTCCFPRCRGRRRSPWKRRT